jgi:hypothetical protein
LTVRRQCIELDGLPPRPEPVRRARNPHTSR